MGWDVACKSKGTRWNNAKLANVKVPSIPTSAACCDDVQLTNAESSSYTFTTANYFIGLRPPNTDTSSYLQPSITPSDCVLQTQIPLVIYNRQLLHRTASSFKPLM